MAGERQNGPFRVEGVHGPHFEYETTWIGAVRDLDDPTDDHGHMVLFQTGSVPNAPLSDDRDVSAPDANVAQFLMCDGSVHTVSDDIDLTVYRRWAPWINQKRPPDCRRGYATFGFLRSARVGKDASKRSKKPMSGVSKTVVC